MITVTDEARDFLSSAFEKVSLNAEKGECFRITKEDDNKLAIVAGIQAQEDVVIASGDSTLLVIGSSLSEELGDRTLDVRQSAEGQKALVWA